MDNRGRWRTPALPCLAENGAAHSAQKPLKNAEKADGIGVFNASGKWLPPRDSNPDTQIQRPPGNSSSPSKPPKNRMFRDFSHAPAPTPAHLDF